MLTPRFYQDREIAINQIFNLTPEAAHHLTSVLRGSVNSLLTVFNGLGGEFKAKVLSITKRDVTVKTIAYYSENRESNLAIHLGQALLPSIKMDYLIQKSVELGVKKITALFTERCKVKLAQERQKNRLIHWRNIAISACEQCGRNIIPEIIQPTSFDDWITQVKTKTKWILAPFSNYCLSQVAEPTTDITLLIGSEGGFSSKEMLLAEEQHFIPLYLGPRILRAETATLSALAMLQGLFGDMR